MVYNLGTGLNQTCGKQKLTYVNYFLKKKIQQQDPTRPESESDSGVGSGLGTWNQAD